MVKDIKEVIHLYLGCECEFYHEGFNFIPTVGKLKELYIDGSGNNISSVYVGNRSINEKYFNYIKPILRSLDDITEEECIWIANLAFTEEVTPLDRAAIGKEFIQYTFLGKGLNHKMIESVEEIGIEHSFELTRYLLSKHFDLFGLIESGLAIDKNKK